VLCGVQALPALTLQRIDMGFVFAHLVFSGQMLFMPSSILVVCAPGRTAFRAFVSAVLMRTELSSFMNLLHSLVACWVVCQTPVVDASSGHNGTVEFCLNELVSWICITSLCRLTEAGLKEELQNELLATSAKQATERLLAGLCDTVVRLGKDFRIVQATPKLMHLMCPTSPVNHCELEGSLFSSHLATESDRERYKK